MSRADRFVTVDGTEIHYSEWGDPGAEPVVCVHSFSRVGRDFDPIAGRLAPRFRVICPDMPGSGLSAWADDPEREYTPSAFEDVLVAFLDALGIGTTRWIGTSMGGGLGASLAAGRLRERISHLVVNDAGIAAAGDEDPFEHVERAVGYLADPPAFGTVTELEGFYRRVYAGTGPMTDDEWRRFTVTSARRTDDGRVTPDYDPRMPGPFVDDIDPIGWDVWDAIAAETFVVRGTDSPILPDPVFDEMTDRTPDAETLEVDCGHAPALTDDEQIEPIAGFLSD